MIGFYSQILLSFLCVKSLNLVGLLTLTDKQRNILFFTMWIITFSSLLCILSFFGYQTAGDRTFGVLTKIDLMDQGTNAVDVSMHPAGTRLNDVLPIHSEVCFPLSHDF